MKKINLKGISEILSEKEMKNVMGGSGTVCNNGGACDGSRYCIDGNTSGYCQQGLFSCYCGK